MYEKERERLESFEFRVDWEVDAFIEEMAKDKRFYELLDAKVFTLDNLRKDLSRGAYIDDEGVVLATSKDPSGYLQDMIDDQA